MKRRESAIHCPRQQPLRGTLGWCGWGVCGTELAEEGQKAKIIHTRTRTSGPLYDWLPDCSVAADQL